MKPISQAWFCQIELTSFCGHGCIYCSRYDRHLKQSQRMHMSLETLDKALASLKEFPARIGIIGGEPTCHPQFRMAMTIIRARYPRQRMGLWTMGGALFDRNRDEIEDTFGFIACNPHDEHQKEVCKHQPLTVAIRDAVPDPVLRAALIDDCWVQRTWCPTIAPWGKAFFCEVAYALAAIQDCRGGYELTPDWWKRTPAEFKDQVDALCGLCGMAIPMPRQKLSDKRELVSPSVLAILREYRLPKSGGEWVELCDHQFTPQEIEANKKTWFPGNYRGDVYEDGKNPEGPGSTR